MLNMKMDQMTQSEISVGRAGYQARSGSKREASSVKSLIESMES